jgi:hypothetical protein
LQSHPERVSDAAGLGRNRCAFQGASLRHDDGSHHANRMSFTVIAAPVVG